MNQELVYNFLQDLKAFCTKFQRVLGITPNERASGTIEFWVEFFRSMSLTIQNSQIGQDLKVENVCFSVSNNVGGGKILKLAFKINDNRQGKVILRSISISTKDSIQQNTKYSEKEIGVIENYFFDRDARKTEATTIDLQNTDSQTVHLNIKSSNIQHLQDNKQYGHGSSGTNAVHLQKVIPLALGTVKEGADQARDKTLDDILGPISNPDTASAKNVQEFFSKLRELYHNNQVPNKSRSLEAEAHGFTYGAFTLTYKRKYAIDIYVEQSGGKGFLDMSVIFRKMIKSAKNQNIIDTTKGSRIIIEFKKGEGKDDVAQAGLDQIIDEGYNYNMNDRNENDEIIAVGLNFERENINEMIKVKMNLKVTQPKNFIQQIVNFQSPMNQAQITKLLKDVYLSIRSEEKLDLVLLGNIVAQEDITNIKVFDVNKDVLNLETNTKVTIFSFKHVNQNYILTITDTDSTIDQSYVLKQKQEPELAKSRSQTKARALEINQQVSPTTTHKSELDKAVQQIQKQGNIRDGKRIDIVVNSCTKDHQGKDIKNKKFENPADKTKSYLQEIRVGDVKDHSSTNIDSVKMYTEYNVAQGIDTKKLLTALINSNPANTPLHNQDSETNRHVLDQFRKLLFSAKDFITVFHEAGLKALIHGLYLTEFKPESSLGTGRADGIIKCDGQYYLLELKCIGYSTNFRALGVMRDAQQQGMEYVTHSKSFTNERTLAYITMNINIHAVSYQAIIDYSAYTSGVSHDTTDEGGHSPRKLLSPIKPNNIQHARGQDSITGIGGSDTKKRVHNDGDNVQRQNKQYARGQDSITGIGGSDTKKRVHNDGDNVQRQNKQYARGQDSITGIGGSDTKKIDEIVKEAWKSLNSQMNNSTVAYATGLSGVEIREITETFPDHYGMYKRHNQPFYIKGRSIIDLSRSTNEYLSRVLPTPIQGATFTCVPKVTDQEYEKAWTSKSQSLYSDAKYYCDNAVVIEHNVRKKQDADKYVIFDLNNMNSGEVYGSNELNNIFLIQDSNIDVYGGHNVTNIYHYAKIQYVGRVNKADSIHCADPPKFLYILAKAAKNSEKISFLSTSSQDLIGIIKQMDDVFLQYAQTFYSDSVYIDSKGGNKEEFDLIKNCKTLALSPYTKVEGSYGNDTIYVQLEGYQNQNTTSDIDVKDAGTIIFPKTLLLQDCKKIAYSKVNNTLSLIVPLAQSGLLTLNVRNYYNHTSNKPNFDLIDKYYSNVIPQINVNNLGDDITTINKFILYHKSITTFSNLTYTEISSHGNHDYSVFTKIQRLTDQGKEKIWQIGSRDNDLMILTNHDYFAGRKGHDTYLVDQLAENNTWITINNFSKDNAIDYLVLPCPIDAIATRKYSRHDYLFIKCHSHPLHICISQYFKDAAHQHHAIIDNNGNSYIPFQHTDHTIRLIPFLHINGNSNTFTLPSTLLSQSKALVVDIARNNIKFYKAEDHLVISSKNTSFPFSIEFTKNMIVTISDFFLSSLERQNISCYIYNNGAIDYTHPTNLAHIAYNQNIETLNLNLDNIVQIYDIYNISVIIHNHGKIKSNFLISIPEDSEKLAIISFKDIALDNIKAKQNNYDLIFYDSISEKQFLIIKDSFLVHSYSPYMLRFDIPNPIDIYCFGNNINDLNAKLDHAKKIDQMKCEYFNSDSIKNTLACTTALISSKLDIDINTSLGFSSLEELLLFIADCHFDQSDINNLRQGNITEVYRKFIKEHLELLNYSNNEKEQYNEFINMLNTENMINAIQPFIKGLDDKTTPSIINQRHRRHVDDNILTIDPQEEHKAVLEIIHESFIQALDTVTNWIIKPFAYVMNNIIPGADSAIVDHHKSFNLNKIYEPSAQPHRYIISDNHIKPVIKYKTGHDLHDQQFAFNRYKNISNIQNIDNLLVLRKSISTNSEIISNYDQYGAKSQHHIPDIIVQYYARGIVYLFPNIHEGKNAPQPIDYNIQSESFNIKSCRPIIFNDHDSVYCEGHHTNMIYSPLPQTRIFDGVDGQIILFRIVAHWAKSVWDYCFDDSSKKSIAEQYRNIDREIINYWNESVYNMEDLLRKIQKLDLNHEDKQCVQYMQTEFFEIRNNIENDTKKKIVTDKEYKIISERLKSCIDDLFETVQRYDVAMQYNFNHERNIREFSGIGDFQHSPIFNQYSLLNKNNNSDWTDSSSYLFNDNIVSIEHICASNNILNNLIGNITEMS